MAPLSSIKTFIVALPKIGMANKTSFSLTSAECTLTCRRVRISIMCVRDNKARWPRPLVTTSCAVIEIV